jgi:hypothetical protein
MVRNMMIVSFAVIFILLAILCCGNWSGFYARGHETCVRCGAVVDVERYLGVESARVVDANAAHVWFERHASPCSLHRWRQSGCWREGLGRISCCETPTGHAWIAALASLDDANSIALARSFAALPEPIQRALWSTANQAEHPTSIAGNEHAVIEAVTSSVQWRDPVPVSTKPR